MSDPAVKMIDRIVTILRLLGSGDDRGVPLAEVCLATALQKTTAHRVLRALCDTGLVFQDVVTRNYRLGAAAADLARSAVGQDISGAARPSLVRLATKTGDTAFASIHEGAAAICVAREVGDFPIRTLTLSVGDRRPLGVGAGSLALLAALGDDVIENVLERNKVWLRDFHGFNAAEIRARVARTRSEGFALNKGGIVPGMSGIGVAVVDKAGVPVTAISIAAINDRMSESRIADIVAALQAESRVIGNVLRTSKLAAE